MKQCLKKPVERCKNTYLNKCRQVVKEFDLILIYHKSDDVFRYQNANAKKFRNGVADRCPNPLREPIAKKFVRSVKNVHRDPSKWKNRTKTAIMKRHNKSVFLFMKRNALTSRIKSVASHTKKNVKMFRKKFANLLNGKNVVKCQCRNVKWWTKLIAVQRMNVRRNM